MARTAAAPRACRSCGGCATGGIGGGSCPPWRSGAVSTDLTGKTIVRTSDYGDTLYFSDGTSATSGEYGLDFHDWAETQERLHREQGDREQARMRRLHDSLHPRDQQWLRLQERIQREK